MHVMYVLLVSVATCCYFNATGVHGCISEKWLSLSFHGL